MGEGHGGAHTEIVLGLVGASGSALGTVGTEIENILHHYAYGHRTVRLSSLLEEYGQIEPFDTNDSDGVCEDSRIWNLMEAGNDLRRRSGRNDALAILGCAEIADHREGAGPTESATDAADDPKELPHPLSRFAYILRSLKHPDEVSILREIYGPRFILIGVYTPRGLREKNLKKLIGDSRGTYDEAQWSHSVDALILKDAAEESDYGQQVAKTFHRSDVFVSAGDDGVMRSQLERSFEIIFGNPYRTPNRDELAMFQASGAALRSAEPGRQVGAALATTDGSIIALGANEVPKAGGGQYWDGSESDGREFAIHGSDLDENRTRIVEIASEILAIPAIQEQVASSGEAVDQAAIEQILQTKLGDITEFGRAVHAEMAVLMDAAMRGVPVEDSTAFTTTFPCHNCARHLIGAGIRRLVYVSPYPKSVAGELHNDAIAIECEPSDGEVIFEPFVGIAPRRYRQFFSQEFKDRSQHFFDRKTETGEIFEFSDAMKKEAIPVIVDLESPELVGEFAPYQVREQKALDLLAAVLDGKD